MTYSFVNRPAIKNDLFEAVTHYQKINPELAKQFLFRIREAKTYIVSNPLSFQIKYSNVRTLLLKQFPYHIHYLIDDSKKVIVILAIIHAYKNPTNYFNR